MSSKKCWECFRCGKINAPWREQCTCIPEDFKKCDLFKFVESGCSLGWAKNKEGEDEDVCPVCHVKMTRVHQCDYFILWECPNCGKKENENV